MARLYELFLSPFYSLLEGDLAFDHGALIGFCDRQFISQDDA